MQALFNHFLDNFIVKKGITRNDLQSMHFLLNDIAAGEAPPMQCPVREHSETPPGRSLTCPCVGIPASLFAKSGQSAFHHLISRYAVISIDKPKTLLYNKSGPFKGFNCA